MNPEPDARVTAKKRTFSKRMVVINTALAWAAVFTSIVYAQAAAVAATAMFLVLAINGVYMGIGHADLKEFLKSMIPSAAAAIVDPPKDFAG